MVSLTPDEFLGIDVTQRYHYPGHAPGQGLGQGQGQRNGPRQGQGSSSQSSNGVYNDEDMIRNLPSLLAAAESHHRHLAALEFTSMAFLPCAPTPIAEPYSVASPMLIKDKGSDNIKNKGLEKELNQQTDQGSDKDKDKGSEQDSLLARILHKGVLGAFATLTTDIPTPSTSSLSSAAATAAASAAAAATLPPALSQPRAPLTLNNKGDEENSPVRGLTHSQPFRRLLTGPFPHLTCTHSFPIPSFDLTWHFSTAYLHIYPTNTPNVHRTSWLVCMLFLCTVRSLLGSVTIFTPVSFMTAVVVAVVAVAVSVVLWINPPLPHIE